MEAPITSEGNISSTSTGTSTLHKSLTTSEENISTPSTSMHTTHHSNDSTPSSNTSNPPSISTPSSSNMISKYLVQYVPALLEKRKAAEIRVTGS